MYSLIRTLLFQLKPESVHELIIAFSRFAGQFQAIRSLLEKTSQYEDSRLNVSVGNLDFPNPIGLAAGFDKNGQAVDMLQSLGFGAIEVGTVTPKAQPGNPKPRLFRLKEDQAMINRMGFNNDGVNALVERLRGSRKKIPIGINLGKNKSTEIDEAVEDYLIGLYRARKVADYFTINISSPNTKNLRNLQQESYLYPLIRRIMETRDQLASKSGKSKQIWLKIAPDLSDQELEIIVGIALELKVDALIVNNTTISRPDLISEYRNEVGGLSGKPIACLSDQILKKTYELTRGKIPIIGVGGIFSAEDVFRKISLGASMVQIFTGLIYKGPGLVKKINRELIRLMDKSNCRGIKDLTACAVKK